MEFGLAVEHALRGVVELFTQPGIGGTLAAGVLATSVVVLLFSFLWYVPARREIARAREAVARAAGPDVHARRAAFAQQYEAIAGRLETLKRIGPAWIEFSDTLIRPDDSNIHAFGSRNVRNVRRPDEFISLRSVGMAGDVVRSIPGVIVGLGLVLTFVGLIAALSVAAGNLDAATTPTGMRNVLGTLLGTAGAKFYASATALLCSIVLGLVQRFQATGLARRLQKFNHDLEVVLQYDATALTRVEQLRVMGEQNDQLRELAADFALQIGDRVAEKVSPLNAELGATLQQVAGKLDRIADQTGTSIAATLGDRFELALSETLSKLDATLQMVRAELAALPEQLNVAVGAMDAAAGSLADRFGQAADVGAERATAGLDAGLAPILAALESAARTIESAGATVARGADQALAAVSDRFGVAGSGFEEAASRAGAALARESEAVAARFGAAGNGLEEAAARAGVALARESEAVAARFGTAGAGLEDAAARAGAALAREGEAVAVRFGAVGSGFEEAAMRAGAALTRESEAVAARFGSAGAGFEEAAVRAAAVLARESEAAAVRFAAAVAPVEAAGAAMGRASAAIAGEADKMAGAAGRLSVSLGESATAHRGVATLVTEATRSAEAATARQDTLLVRTGTAAERIERSSTVMAEAVETLRTTTDNLAARAERLASDSRAVQAQVAETHVSNDAVLRKYFKLYDCLWYTVLEDRDIRPKTPDIWIARE